MFKGNRNTDFAFLILIAALFSIVSSIVVLEVVADADYQAIEANADQGQASNHSPIEHSSDYNWDKPVWGPWYGLWFERTDTAAQWLMAFFTVAATVVLVLTLRAANNTNKAAIKANRIMREEQRPWIEIEVTASNTIYQVKSSDGETKFIFTLDIAFKNTGKTVARDVLPVVEIFDTKRLHSRSDRLEAISRVSGGEGTRKAMFPNSKDGFTNSIAIPVSRFEPIIMSDSTEKLNLMMMAIVKYKSPLSDKWHYTAEFYNLSHITIMGSSLLPSNLDDVDKTSFGLTQTPYREIE